MLDDTTDELFSVFFLLDDSTDELLTDELFLLELSTDELLTDELFLLDALLLDFTADDVLLDALLLDLTADDVLLDALLLGTRMKSKLYKVLHPVCGKAMVVHECRADGLYGGIPTQHEPDRRCGARSDRRAAAGCRGELHHPQALDLPPRRRTLLQCRNRRDGPAHVFPRRLAHMENRAHGVRHRSPEPAGLRCVPLCFPVRYYGLRIFLPSATCIGDVHDQVQFEISDIK